MKYSNDFVTVKGYTTSQQREKIHGAKPGGNQEQASQGSSHWDATRSPSFLQQQVVTTRVECCPQGELVRDPGFLLEAGHMAVGAWHESKL